MIEHHYCPACREYTALIDRGICPWCDTPLEQRKKRGGLTSKFTDAQLRALHRVHIEQRLSINQLAKRVHERVDCRSHHSAAVAISKGWKRLRLPARDRIEATRVASTKHGLAPKHGPRPGYGTYKRRMLRGEQDRPRCAGIKANPPGKGQPCLGQAMESSDFCFAHDPLRALEVQAITARMRRRRQPRRDMLPFAPFGAWVEGLHRELGGSLAATVGELGCSRSTVHNFSTAWLARRRGVGSRARRSAKRR